MSLASAKVLIALIGLGLSSAAIAEDFVYYGSDLYKSDYYYDAETIRRYDDGDVDVWTKRDASKDKTVPYRTQRAKLRLNCASETISSLSFVLYRANGTVVDSDTPIYPDIESVVPGSVGQTLFDIMCETDLRRQFNLGLKYAEGKGVARDYVAAVSWYRMAADRGYADAQNNLGIMYKNGRGVAQDDAIALSWFRKAADQGNATAQTNLGNMYDTGRGVSQDYAAAVIWYRKAADQGFATAQNNLGNMYKNGRGVAQDDAIALSWFRKAAYQGHASAQNNLGNMYKNGSGAPQNYVQALKWYVLSSASGNQQAKVNRDEVVAKMTPTEIAQAQRFASAWVKE